VTTFDLFQLAERIELAAAELYATLAKQFADDEGARALFVRLEQEELQHAARVRMLASHYRKDPKLVGHVTGAGALGHCELQVRAALAEVQAGAWGRELDPILTRLSLLEDALAKAHADAMAEHSNDGLRDFFRQLSAQDAAHHQLLRTR
jgi:hypothetical protein